MIMVALVLGGIFTVAFIEKQRQAMQQLMAVRESAPEKRANVVRTSRRR